MSTISGERDGMAPAADSAGPAANRDRPTRVTRLVFGSLSLIAALALIGAAIAAIFGLETNRDSRGYFVTHTHHYQTSSYALSTESLNVGGMTGILEAGLVRLRIAATSNVSAKPLFIGIARTQDVNTYLAHVQHDELRDINFDPFKIDYRRLGTGAPSARPTTQNFWKARASGTGTQSITWAVKKGHWSAVVMNGDGSRNIGVDAQLAARLSGAWWFVAGFLIVGAALLAGGVVLIRSGQRSPASESAPATADEVRP